MKPVRTTCPYCGELTHLAPTEIFLALNDADAATGDYAYTCPQCLRTGVHAADQATIAALLAAGVLPLPVETPPLPRAAAALSQRLPPADRPFTPDDLADLHALLQTDSWLDALLASSRRPGKD